MLLIEQYYFYVRVKFIIDACVVIIIKTTVQKKTSVFYT